jgi:hypothetical protein
MAAPSLLGKLLRYPAPGASQIAGRDGVARGRNGGWRLPAEPGPASIPGLRALAERRPLRTPRQPLFAMLTTRWWLSRAVRLSSLNR